MKSSTWIAAGYLIGVGTIGFILGLWTADGAATVKSAVVTYQTLISSFSAFIAAGAVAVLGYRKMDAEGQQHREKLSAEAAAAQAKLQRVGVAMIARVVSMGRQLALSADILQGQPDMEALRLEMQVFIQDQYPAALKTCDDVIAGAWANMSDIDALAIDGMTVRLAQLRAIADDARRLMVLSAEVQPRPIQLTEVRALDFMCWRMIDNMLRMEPAFSDSLSPPARPEFRADYEAQRDRIRGQRS